MKGDVSSLVKCPKANFITRCGRGFSLGEVKEAGLKVDQLKITGLPIDKRRRTAHKENIEALKSSIRGQASKKGRVISLDNSKTKKEVEKPLKSILTTARSKAKTNRPPRKIAAKPGRKTVVK